MKKIILMPLMLMLFAGIPALAQNSITTVVTGDVVIANVPADSLLVTSVSREVAFNLSTMPAVGIEYCQLQLTCAANVNTAVALKVLTSSGAEIANHYLKKGYKVGQLITFNIPKTYFVGGRAQALRFQLGTKDPGLVMKFYGSSNRAGSNQQFAPRLVLKYNADEIAGTEWASFYADGQHKGQSRTEFRGTSPDGFNFNQVTMTGDIKQNLLMYDGRVLVVTNGQLLAYDASSLQQETLQSMPAPSDNGSPVIDTYGHFYYPEANQVSVIELNNRNNVKAEKIATGFIKTPLTIGADGRLYVVTEYKVSAYSPYPQNKLLWDINLPGNKSSVVLSGTEQVAYIINRVDGNSPTMVMMALDANNGRQLNKQVINVSAVTGNLPAPVTGDDGSVYYIDKLENAENLFVLNADLKQVSQVNGKNISFPTAGGVAASQDNYVYYLNDAQLFKYTPATLRHELVEALGTETGSKTTLITDAGNNIYVLGEQDFYYRPAGGNFIRITNQPVKSDFKMVLGADGTLFAAAQKTLLAIKPANFSGSYAIGSNDTDPNRNFLSFRASDLIINDGFKFINTKVLVATKSIRFNQGINVGDKAHVLIKKRGDGTVSFSSGFTVQKGASFKVMQNY